MTLNTKKVLIISNLVTIAVTAVAVLMGLHFNDQQSMMQQSSMMQSSPHEQRHLQACCDCNTGLPLEDDEGNGNGGGGGGGGLCFPNDATVQLVHGEHVPLGSVKIGTIVHVGNNRYEPIYAFGHYDTETTDKDYIKLSTTDDKFLVVSPQHMVWTCSSHQGSFVPASDVTVGDELFVAGGDGCTPVTNVETNVSSQGLLAPFTPSGTIVVNGIKVSSFVALSSDYPYPQGIAHAFEFPHRIMCHYLGSCPDETYTEDGISTWVAKPLEWCLWILDTLPQHHAVWTVLFHGLVIAVIGISRVMELVLFEYPILAAAGAYYSYSRRGAAHKTIR